MPAIGPLEILIVAVIALIVFGPKRLPEIARNVGKAMAELRRQAADIRSEFESGLEVPPEDVPAGDRRPKAVTPASRPEGGEPATTTPNAKEADS